MKKIANWSNYPKISAKEIKFEYQPDLLVHLANNGPLIARGMGRCYGDASLNDKVVSTLRYNKILEFDKTSGIICSQAGITLENILDVIVPKGWFLPVTPGTKYITLGGAVASDVHGKNHHKDGSFSNFILEMSVMLAGGEVVSCSPTSNKELFETTCGGMGLTGIILNVKFKLVPIKSVFIAQRTIKAKNLDHIFELFEAHKNYTYSVAWIDCLKGGRQLGRSILMLGEHAEPGELTSRENYKTLTIPKKPKISIPFHFPGFILNQHSIKAFNVAYYHKQLSNEQKNIIDYDTFFYPLDSILHWNRMYGKNGFLQYQFVLPLENSKEGLRTILGRIRQSNMGSFLAVLKLFGKQESLISFPMEGYTLALDFPIRNGLFRFLKELDRLVLGMGGRIYLSKDARMEKETFWKGYPNANLFLEKIKKYNPGFKFQSLQSKRLNITQ